MKSGAPGLLEFSIALASEPYPSANASLSYPANTTISVAFFALWLAFHAAS